MIKHIVMWKFLPDKEKEINEFLDGLRSLYGVIPQIKSQEIGVNCSPDQYDAVLISSFDSLDDLQAYKTDPRHVKVSALCKSIRSSRAAVDFEV